MKPSPGILQSNYLKTLFFFLVLFSIAFITGQKGIPVEDGGEFLTVARLGGINHPPGLPLLSLASRLSWILFGSEGLRILFACASAAALLLIMNRPSISLFLVSAGLLLLPSIAGRLLIWDAYGPLFLIFAVTLHRKPNVNLEGGYLMGLAMAVHPQGIFLPVLFEWKQVSILRFLCGLLLGLSVYLALPVYSASGAIVDWGSTGSIVNFLRQVTAGGYREVYGGSMGVISADVFLRHIGELWKIVWPVLLLPIVIGFIRLYRINRSLMIRLEILIIADLLFVSFINPMASGTTQTAVISLFAAVVISITGISALEKWNRKAGILVAGIILIAGGIMWNGIPDQRDTVEEYFAPAPFEAAYFLSSNDLLYGGWVLKYVEDRRPDIVLMSTGNFSGWFENMVVRFNPDMDLSTGVSDIGDYTMSREEAADRLINAAIQDNPGRLFFRDY